MSWSPTLGTNAKTDPEAEVLETEDSDGGTLEKDAEDVEDDDDDDDEKVLTEAAPIATALALRALLVVLTLPDVATAAEAAAAVVAFAIEVRLPWTRARGARVPDKWDAGWSSPIPAAPMTEGTAAATATAVEFVVLLARRFLPFGAGSFEAGLSFPRALSNPARYGKRHCDFSRSAVDTPNSLANRATKSLIVIGFKSHKNATSSGRNVWSDGNVTR